MKLITNIHLINPQHIASSNPNCRHLAFNQNSSDMFIRTQKAISFGWCEPHVGRRDEVSAEFVQRLEKQRLEEQKRMEEQRKREEEEAQQRRMDGIVDKTNQEFRQNQEKQRYEMLELESKSALEVAGFMLDFVNRQKNEAEFIPLWVIETNPKVQEALDNSKTASDPVQGLIMMSGLQKFNAKNGSLNSQDLVKAMGSVQLHAAIVLLEQIEKNTKKGKVLLTDQEKQCIAELCDLVDQSIDKTYGKGLRDKVKALCTDRPLSDSEKRATRDLLIDIDNKAALLDFGEEFASKLKALLEHQREMEKRKIRVEVGYKREVIIGSPLSQQARAVLEKKIEASKSSIEREALQLMLDTNREIRLNAEKLSAEQVHMREHLLDHGHVHRAPSQENETDKTIEISHHTHEHVQDHQHSH